MQLFILPFFTFQLFWRHTQSLAPISSPKMMTTSSCLADYLVVSCEGGGRSVIDGGGGGGTGGRGVADRPEENEAAAAIRRDDADDVRGLMGMILGGTDVLEEGFWA